VSLLKDPTLRRFWFALAGGIGVGVTAHSRSEAEALASDACEYLGQVFNPVNVVEDVDVRDLDQNHVIPNMGPPNFRGVWYPRMNI
jgi:hypothetical protein